MSSCKNFIYALSLKGNKYYVGTTNNPPRRYSEHISNSTRWVNKWKVDTQFGMQLFEQSHLLQEDIVTKEYMMAHGVINVRGGSYANMILGQAQLNALQKEFDTAYKCCFKCGDPLNASHECGTPNNFTYCYYCQDNGHRMLNCPYRYSYD